MAAPVGTDSEVRQRAFQFLDDLRAAHGDALPYEVLKQGFELRGSRIYFMGPQGIFKPAILRMPLSIRTTPDDRRRPRPYEDAVGEGGVIHYKYRDTAPSHHENRGLREAMRQQAPLIYFVGLAPGRYYAEYPVYVVGDDLASHTFHVQADDQRLVAGCEAGVAEPTTAARRVYITVLAQR